MKSKTSVEYVPIRHVITFIAYKMNWSIVRVAEWLLARDYEQYSTAYEKSQDSNYYEINDTKDIYDTATRYLLKKTINIGHDALYSEGDKETSKYFYQAYYKMDDINKHHILDRLELDFNQIYDFGYNTDPKGFVNAINHSSIDDVKNDDNKNIVEQQLANALAKIDNLEQSQSTGSFSMGTPMVEHGEPKTNEQLINELAAANDQIAELKTQLEQSTTDIRSYTTPAMNIMDKVITEFWLDYNPNQSAPKQEVIVRWITDNFDGVSKALALNIDKVCRHSDAKKGGQYKK